MSNKHRRMGGVVGMAVGAVLASPLIALLASPVASADTVGDLVGTSPDVTSFGPFTFDGYTDTFSINTSTDAFDNYLTGTFSGSAFDLDTYFGPSGSDSFEVLLTDPGVLQLGVDDVGGSISYVDNFLGIDFIPTDPGLALLG